MIFDCFIYLFFSDSETTEDEGGDQFETKEDDGDVEDQAVHTGIHHVINLHLFFSTIYFCPTVVLVYIDATILQHLLTIITEMF